VEFNIIRKKKKSLHHRTLEKSEGLEEHENIFPMACGQKMVGGGKNGSNLGREVLLVLQKGLTAVPGLEKRRSGQGQGLLCNTWEKLKIRDGNDQEEKTRKELGKKGNLIHGQKKEQEG